MNNWKKFYFEKSKKKVIQLEKNISFITIYFVPIQWHVTVRQCTSGADPGILVMGGGI